MTTEALAETEALSEEVLSEEALIEKARTERADIDSHWPIVTGLLPLLDCASERDGWCRAVEIAAKFFGADLAAAIERVDDERVTVHASIGMSTLEPDLVFPIAPDSQAAFVFESTGPVRSDDIRVDDRFVGGRLLTEIGVVSSMAVSFDLPDDRTAVISLHSTEAAAFREDDLSSFATLGNFFSLAMRRIRRRIELEHGAHFDLLTGLANRPSVLSELAERFETSDEVSVMVIDLDGFKAVNDDLGHPAGDSVLSTVATRLDRSVRLDDRLGRLGGDEFLLITDDVDLMRRADHLIGHVEEAILVDDRLVQISASIGIARRRPDDTTTTLIERADRLMYRAKSTGRGAVCLDVTTDPAPVGTRRVPSTRTTKTNLAVVDDAVARLRLVFQPIVHTSTHELHGVEALTRGPVGHPLQFPDQLFPAAATFGRAGELELASKISAFDAALPDAVALYINVEPALLCDVGWLEALTEAWVTARSRPQNRLTIDRVVVAELTERAVLRSPGRLLRAVQACRNLGWRIALDDVGSRSESLAALRWIRPDVIKLDMSLIENDNPAHSANIVAAVDTYRNMHDSMDISVIAEGVETAQHERRAVVLGADRLQGYRFGRPGPVEDLAARQVGEPGIPVQPSSKGRRRRATKRELLHLSRHVESGILTSDCVLLSALQHADHLSAHTRRQYRALARRCGFVGMVGVDLSRVGGDDMSGVRTADLVPADPMTHNWHVIVMSPTTSIGLLATEVDDTASSGKPPTDDMQRLFDYELITDPDQVEAAARELLHYF